MQTHKVARLGEQIVFDVLPNAKWINNNGESDEPYDIFWNGIFIDVKTRTHIGMRIGRDFKSFNFGFSYYKERPANWIVVFVGIDENKQTYFWVRRIKELIKDKDKTYYNFYASTRNSITINQLRFLIIVSGNWLIVIEFLVLA